MSQAEREEDSPLLELVLAGYVGEPCRICGEKMTREALDDSWWIGPAKDPGGGRLAHGVCRRNGPPKEKWAYPEDRVREGERDA